jgi:hypothetical protein
MSSEWTRTEKLTLYSLLVAVVGVSVVLLTVPEFRRFLGLSNSVTIPLQATSSSSVSAESPEVPARQSLPNATFSKRVKVPADKMWFDTGITLARGAKLDIRATGQWSDAGLPLRYWGANGTGDTWPGTIVASANLDALVGKVGNVSFLAGESYSGNSPASGKLYLSMNDIPNGFSGNLGTMDVVISYSQH